MLLEAFDSNWIAPIGPDRRRLRARDGREDRRRTCRGPLQRDGGSAPRSAVGRRGARRRGTGSVVHLHRQRRGRHLPGSTPRVRRLLGRQLESGPGPGRGGTDREGRGRPAPRRRDHRRPLRRDRRLRRVGVGVPTGSRCRSSRTRPRPSGRPIGAGPAGSFGVAGIFSFNGNKIITTSGGGMLMTRVARSGPSEPAIWPLRPGSRSPTTSTHWWGTTIGSPTCWPPLGEPSSADSTAASSAESRSTRRTRPGWPASPGSRRCRAP